MVMGERFVPILAEPSIPDFLLILQTPKRVGYLFQVKAYENSQVLMSHCYQIIPLS